ncbi:MAG: hypothetical protein R3362_00190, partial [Rhodothermales bacterium]|nr:hypothetical protein [Rhodothermales bacterium]
MPEVRDFITLVRAGAPLIAVDSREEARLLAVLARVAVQLKTPVYRWSITEGLHRIGAEDGGGGHRDP